MWTQTSFNKKTVYCLPTEKASEFLVPGRFARSSIHNCFVQLSCIKTFSVFAINQFLPKLLYFQIVFILKMKHASAYNRHVEISSNLED